MDAEIDIKVDEDILSSYYFSAIYEAFKESQEGDLDNEIKSLFTKETLQKTDAILYDIKIPKNRPQLPTNPIKRLLYYSQDIFNQDTVNFILDKYQGRILVAQNKIINAGNFKTNFPSITVDEFSEAYKLADGNFDKIEEIILEHRINNHQFADGLLAIRPELTQDEFKMFLNSPYIQECQSIKELYELSLKLIPIAPTEIEETRRDKFFRTLQNSRAVKTSVETPAPTLKSNDPLPVSLYSSDIPHYNPSVHVEYNNQSEKISIQQKFNNQKALTRGSILTIDLHGLRYEEARIFITDCLTKLLNQHFSKLNFITGQGKHSDISTFMELPDTKEKVNPLKFLTIQEAKTKGFNATILTKNPGIVQVTRAL